MKPRTTSGTTSGTPGIPGTVPAPADAADPRWWGPPLVGTLLAPLLSWGAAVVGDLFTALPACLAAGFALPLVVVAPGWFLGRTVRRRRARVGLAAAGCVLAAAYPLLLTQFAWIVFFVMLLTGNVRS